MSAGAIQRLGLLLGAVAVLASCRGAGGTSDPEVVRDLDGVARRPLVVDDAVAHVLIFVMPDCPIANFYAPEIRSICEDHRDDPVRFFLIHADPSVSPEVAAVHQREYALPGPVLLDPTLRLARAAGVEVTPEVVVLTADGDVAYQGRIDNWYGDLGRKRAEVSRHELRDALSAVLAGRPVEVPRTEAIGCYIPYP